MRNIPRAAAIKNIVAIGLYSTFNTLSKLHIPLYSALLGSSTHQLPMGQEYKMLTILAGGFTVVSIGKIGHGIADAYLGEYAKIGGTASGILGCMAQAFVTSKTILSGFIRGSSYEYFGIDYKAIFISEVLYGTSDTAIKAYIAGEASNITLPKIANTALFGFEVSNIMYSTVQCILLPAIKADFHVDYNACAISGILALKNFNPIILYDTIKGLPIIRGLTASVEAQHQGDYTTITTLMNGTITNEVLHTALLAGSILCIGALTAEDSLTPCIAVGYGLKDLAQEYLDAPKASNAEIPITSEESTCPATFE